MDGLEIGHETQLRRGRHDLRGRKETQEIPNPGLLPGPLRGRIGEIRREEADQMEQRRRRVGTEERHRERKGGANWKRKGS